MEMLPLSGGVNASEEAQVFISFVHEEQDAAEAVQQFIEEVLQVKAFVSCDKWAIFAGDQWLDRIKDALARVTVVVLMLSRESVARPWVNFEAGAAWLQGTVIIPVCFKDLRPDDLPKPYSSFQAVDLMHSQYYLITSIAHHLRKIPPVSGDPQEAYRKLQQSLGQH
jgi:hypothetical protein